MTWEGLTPPYATIVADPPWPYAGRMKGTMAAGTYRSAPMPYQTMTTEDIRALPVRDLVANDAHLYLWTTNRYLCDAYTVAENWGFRPTTILVWSKPPRGIMGDYVVSAEFIVYAKRGQPRALSRHVGSVFHWKRPHGHSVKPSAFGDLVEQVSPGPYVELFARAPRLGWDSWGYGYESGKPIGIEAAP